MTDDDARAVMRHIDKLHERIDDLYGEVAEPVTPHGQPPHDAPRMVEGSSWLRLDGAGACRAGDHASCGHASTGRDWFKVV